MSIFRLATPLFVKAAFIAGTVLLGIIIALAFSLHLTGSRLESCRAGRAADRIALQIQNQTVKQWKAEAGSRARERDQALAEARRAEAARAPQVQRLRASAARPDADGPCTISDTLKETRGL